MNRLDAIKARAEAATPGPWVAGYPDGRSPETVFMQPVFESETWEDGEVNWYGYGAAGTIFDEGGHTAADATFIAAARTDVPLLLAVAEAALVAINGLLSTGWLMDSLTAEEGWTGEPNSHQWLYDAIVTAGDALRPLLEPDR